MGNNQPNQNQHCVIPTERSDEGSLTSVAFGPYGRRTSFRDDKQKTNMSYTDVLRETQQAEFPLQVTRRINGKKKSSVIAQDSAILSQDTPRDASLRSA